MENKQFYIKYLTNGPVKVETHYIGEKDRRRPLTDVGDLVAAFQARPGSLLANTDSGLITLHLPDSIARSASGLGEDCFANVDETDTTLDTGCSLSSLGSLGSNSKMPLLIINNAVKDWNYLSNLFINVSTFEETSIVVESDRLVNFKSRPMALFKNNKWCLKKGHLPDLRFQNNNIKTKIQLSVNYFLNGNDFLGTLIGPTGCGKSHEMLNRAKSQFTIFIDAQSYPASSEPNDVSLSALKQSFEFVTNSWNNRNQDLDKLRTIAYKFVLSRMLFLKHLKEMYPGLTPTQFLIHQFFNSHAIQNCFVSLSTLSYQELILIRNQFIDFECLFCVDEAHVLAAHLGDLIITTMKGNHTQYNNDVNENAKRGTLSILLYAIKDGQFASKVLFAGTSSKLRNIDNFGTHETKQVSPVQLDQFTAWDCEMALNYVSLYVDIPRAVLENILTDNYRPRILENLVYDLFSLGMNDNESPTTKSDRVEKCCDLLDINDITKESYEAVIHRFTRVSIEPIALLIRNYSHEEIMLKLLLSSMMTSYSGPINCQLSKSQREFFMDTIGSVYLIYGGFEGYSLFEGYVIDAFVILFEPELKDFKLWSSLNLLKDIVRLEGKKTTAKGTPFEAVVLADIMKRNSRDIVQLLSDFDIDTTYDLNQLHLPTVERKLDDEIIISYRPLNAFFRPSNQFRPDILAFLSNEVCLSFGIKIYTSNISSAVHDDNLKSTDPDLFFSKAGQSTNKDKRSLWKKSIKDMPFKFSVRFLIELPEPVGTVSTENFHVLDGIETVIILITKSNMRKILSEEVSLFVEFITK